MTNKLVMMEKMRGVFTMRVLIAMRAGKRAFLAKMLQPVQQANSLARHVGRVDKD